METEERLASSGVPLRSRLKNESVRSYVLRLVGTAGRARRAAEMYLDIYEELRFTDAEISEAQYRDFLKLFAVVIDSLDLLVGGMLHADIRGSGNGNSPLLSVRLSKCLLSWKCSCGGGSGGSAHTNRIVTMKLTSAVVCARHPDLDLFQITNVDFSGLGVTEIDDTSAIAGLRRLNLSGNKLRGDSLWGIQWNRGLRHLDISRNQVDSLEHLAELNSLEVLNAGKNKIRMLKHLESLLNLKALILNDNEIAAVNDLGRFQELNTLAFSIGTPMLSLTKLVLSHNNLHEFPDLCSCPSLKELRLNGNKIATIPQLDLITPLLELLDLGNNPILAKSNILSIIVLRRLSNLSLKGCPLERDFLAGSGSVDAQLVVSKFPGIATFSGRPICARKKKRRRNDRR